MRKRVTISLPEDVARELERLVVETRAPNRSALIERAVRLLARAMREREIEASLDAYYGNRQDSEIREEEAMVAAFNRSQRRLDLDDEGE